MTMAPLALRPASARLAPLCLVAGLALTACAAPVIEHREPPVPLATVVAAAPAVLPIADAGSPPPNAVSTQPPPSGDGKGPAVERLTVFGVRSRQERYDQALGFVRSYAKPERSGQIGRWAEAVCPTTIGLSPSLDAYVSERIETLAGLVGAPGPKQVGCRPNIEIIFTDEPQKVMEEVAVQKEGAFLGFHYAAQEAALRSVRHPIEARYLTSTQDATGASSADVETGSTFHGSLVSAIGSSAGSSNANGLVTYGCAPSRFTHCTSSFYTNILIVADANAMIGRKLGPIADYIAVLALSHAQSLDECGTLPTILDLFAAKCGDRSAPGGWTPNDLAYLKGLYSMDPEGELFMEKGAIADRMTDESGPEVRADPK
jgi:hypothetical protein